MDIEIFLDLLYLFASIVIHLLLFFVLHIVILRLIRVKGLATTLNSLIAITGLVTLLITFFAFKDAYSSVPTYTVATAGAIIASIFIIGFYCFAGPICADRSPSAHMALVLMENSENGLSRDELRKKYGYEKVFDRRVADFLNAGIASELNNKLRLTRKGCRTALLYLFLIKLLGLSKNY